MKKKKYELYRSYEGKDYNGNNPIEIGKIIDNVNSEEILYVIYDSNCYEKYNYKMCSTSRNENDKKVGYVFIDDENKNLFYNSPRLFIPLLYHELGHFINNNVENGHINLEIMQSRTKVLENGKVMQCELDADKFAVSQVGKNDMIKALEYAKERIIKRNDLGKELAILEFELRIKNIKNL